MSNTPQLERLDYAAVYSSHRVYVVFTKQKIPLWTTLVRWGIRLYQKSPVTWTHTLLMVQDMRTENMYMYEMAVWNGMDLFVVEYDSVRYNSDTSQLIIAQENHYGVIKEEVYHALDVTTMIDTDIEYNWYAAQTDVRLTPWTLLQHLLPTAKDKLTWTCSGLVQALIGMPRYLAYTQPLSPDQLHTYLTTRIK